MSYWLFSSVVVFFFEGFVVGGHAGFTLVLHPEVVWDELRGDRVRVVTVIVTPLISRNSSQTTSG